MRYKCQNCAAVNVVTAGEGGSEIACGRCQQTFVVPDKDRAPGVVYGDFAIDGVLVERAHDADYRATQTSLKREIVLKVLDDELSGNEAFAKTFLETSRKASGLSHPFLCQAIAAGRENGKYYLARERGGERSLRNVLVADGVMDWAQAARYACDLTQALDYAWKEGGLAHFNVKPDYVMVSGDGHARLVDVGLAGLNPDPDSDRIVGTPQYMSPERIVGMDGDTRSDIYSLGVTLFYMVTEHFPFEANKTSQYIDHHLNSTPLNAAHYKPDLPKGFCDVLTVTMHKNPNLRYQTGEQLAGDLQAVLAGAAPAFAAQALDMQRKAEASSAPTAAPKAAIVPEDDHLTESPIVNRQVSPEVKFDDLDNFFDNLESELDLETQSMVPDFSIPTDEFDALIEGLDEDEDDAPPPMPVATPPEPEIKMAMPVAPAGGPMAMTLASETQSSRPVTMAMPVTQPADDDDEDDDDDVPMVKPIALAAPAPPPPSPDDDLAEEVDALFNEPPPAPKAGGIPQHQAGTYPAMTDPPPQSAEQGREQAPPQRAGAGGTGTKSGMGKKKKLTTRMGKKPQMKIRRK